MFEIKSKKDELYNSLLNIHKIEKEFIDELFEKAFEDKNIRNETPIMKYQSLVHWLDIWNTSPRKLASEISEHENIFRFDITDAKKQIFLVDKWDKALNNELLTFGINTKYSDLITEYWKIRTRIKVPTTFLRYKNSKFQIIDEELLGFMYLTKKYLIFYQKYKAQKQE
ncbi:hypothetical protein [[Mycoplasma] gypis]|uniref:Uncharacterized protein n=1 Tax=[Mycoplasma] gypis TaxID=92404 RepID=A0ABZ2RP86_9BACT|nr:hypothetical protein [[Mycoplasma] gypis]MBN0919396.1 hypothetical protein [[Mycoplasma] gypis]